MITIALLNVIIWMLPILAVIHIVAMYFIIKNAVKHALKEIEKDKER